MQLQACPEASGSPELPGKGGKPEQKDVGGGLPNLTFCWRNRHCWEIGGKGNLCIPINPELWWLHCCPEKAPQKLIFFSVAAAPPFFPLFLPVQ